MDRDVARDEMLATVFAVWNGEQEEPGRILFDDTTTPPPPAPIPGQVVKPWARVYVRHGTPDTRAISFTGKRHTVRMGEVTIQLFCGYGNGLKDADRLGKAFEKRLPGKTVGGLEFRDVGAQEAGGDGPWFQTNIIANFEYDDFSR